MRTVRPCNACFPKGRTLPASYHNTTPHHCAPTNSTWIEFRGLFQSRFRVWISEMGSEVSISTHTRASMIKGPNYNNKKTFRLWPYWSSLIFVVKCEKERKSSAGEGRLCWPLACHPPRDKMSAAIISFHSDQSHTLNIRHEYLEIYRQKCKIWFQHIFRWNLKPILSHRVLLIGLSLGT